MNMDNSLSKTEIKTLIGCQGLKVDFVNWGIASRIGKTIILNENILKYPKYCSSVVIHELKHTSGYSTKDIMLDFSEASFLDNLWFCIRNPSGFTQFSPFGWYKNDFTLDVTLLLVYIISFLMIMIFLWVF